MGLISSHIMPLVINSLGGRCTHSNTYTYRRLHRNNCKKPGTRQCAPAWFKRTTAKGLSMAWVHSNASANEQVCCHTSCLSTSNTNHRQGKRHYVYTHILLPGRRGNSKQVICYPVVQGHLPIHFHTNSCVLISFVM